MNTTFLKYLRTETHAHLAVAFAALCLMAGCGRRPENRVQGYVEGEYIYVASPLAGTLENLNVERGMQVEAGDPLFRLDSTPEKAARDEAERRLIQARANWEDAKKGKRPSEIKSLEAQLQQAQAALAFSEKELVRHEKLVHGAGGGTQKELDEARSNRDQNNQRVAQLEADLNTARLGSRADQIEASEANVRAQESTLAKAEWDLGQKQKAAPQAGIVFDTLFRVGEWVAAGRPVVVLLPPANIKVRAFIPETRIGALHAGNAARVLIDGVPEPLSGKVSFVSPQAEFTPPVIFSRESRSKLVFMVEIIFDPRVAATLHPGQPVDVEFAKP